MNKISQYLSAIGKKGGKKKGASKLRGDADYYKTISKKAVAARKKKAAAVRSRGSG